MLALRAGAQRFHAQPLSANDTLKNKLLAALPFKPTGAQARVVAEIERDMALDVPMMRLVQGDVGSGKTLVAALAALRAIAHGKQVALMAPTELLAEQHANNFRNWFAPLGIEVGWLAGKQKGKARLAQQEAIASGQVQMIVGTHAIFQEQVQFNGLALVIIDETASFWRASASGIVGERPAAGLPSASVDHDRHADPPHAGNDCVCRSRYLGDR